MKLKYVQPNKTYGHMTGSD